MKDCLLVSVMWSARRCVWADSAWGCIVNDEGGLCLGWSSLFAFLQAARRSPDQHPLRRARPGAEGDRKYTMAPQQLPRKSDATQARLFWHLLWRWAWTWCNNKMRYQPLFLIVLAWQNRSFSFTSLQLKCFNMYPSWFFSF